MKDTTHSTKHTDETSNTLYTYFRNGVELVTPNKSYASSQTDRDHYYEETDGKKVRWMKAPVTTDVNIKVLGKIRVS